MAKVAGWLAVLALVAGLFGACSDGDDDPDTGPTTAAVSPQASTPGATPEATDAASLQPTPTSEQQTLLIGLPNAAELGEGWEETSRGGALPSETTLCGKSADFTSDVIAGYTNINAGHLSAVVGIARGEGVIDEMRSALEGCSELVSTSGGRTAVYQIEPVDFDTFGDATLAIKASTELEGAPEPSESYFVIIEDGDLVLAVADTFIQASDAEQVKTVVIAAHTALERID